jgi:phosphatidylinositol glycan class M
MKFNAILNLLSAHPFLIGLTIRITLMVLFPLLLDDGILLQGVKYTDIDYDVFTDAARYVSDGRSPFDRHTYRYTPFLALILSYTSEDVWWRKERYFGRMLFCVADTLCGLVILQLRRKARKNNAAASSLSSSNNYVELQDV